MYDCHVGPDERWAWCDTVGRKPSNVHEVWDLKTGKLVQTISRAGDAAMSPDGTTVLVPLAHGLNELAKTAVWRLRKGEPGPGK